MCIACKNREMLNDVHSQVLETTAALVEAFQLIEKIKGKAMSLDAEEQKVYDRLSRFVKQEAPDTTEQGVSANGLEVRIVEVGSAEELADVLAALQNRKPRGNTH